MVTTFPDQQTAVDAIHKRVVWAVLIGGAPVQCTSLTSRYDVNEPVGTCTLTLDLPLPETVTLGAVVEVQAGYPGVMGTIFRGRITGRVMRVDGSGRTATITVPSLGMRLAREDLVDVVFAGPVSPKTMFEALCRRRHVDLYRSDDTTAPDGTTPITYGNSEDANGREVRIPRYTRTVDFLTGAARLVGYRVFDTAEGVRQQRISGLPAAAEAIAIREAWNALEVEREDRADAMTNYREVLGARYTDDDGVNQEIRSIPLAVPDDPVLRALWGEGWARGEDSDPLIDTLALADIVRNVAEIDTSQPDTRVRWRTHLAPLLMPGLTVDVESASLDIAGLQWLMRVEHTINAQGVHTYCEGWRGAGTALPAGDDCRVIPVPGSWHVGDERVPWYLHPNPQGSPIVIPFTVPDYYSSIACYCLAHGTNSQYIGGTNADLTISRFEIWQSGEQVGSGNLDILNEDYNRQLPYGDGDTHWKRLVIPITGSLAPGAAELRIIAGENSSLPTGTKRDDFEVKDVTLRLCGVGLPALPTEVS